MFLLSRVIRGFGGALGSWSGPAASRARARAGSEAGKLVAEMERWPAYGLWRAKAMQKRHTAALSASAPRLVLPRPSCLCC